MRWRRPIIGAIAAMAMVVAITGCGGGGGSGNLVLPPRPSGPDTTALTLPPTSPATTLAPGLTAASSAPPVGAQWETVTGNLAGMPSECGTVGVVSGQPGTDLVVAGAARLGLWALGAGPNDWVQLGGGATVVNRPAWIEWDPTDPARFWEAGTYNGGGVYATTNGGAAFQRLGDLTHVDAVSVDRSDPARQTLLAGKHEMPVLSRSTDGGQTWTEVSSGLSDSGQAFAPLVVDRTTHLVGTKGSPTSGIFRTTDGGATWTQVHEGEITSQPLVLADGTILWASATGMVSSQDRGATWTTQRTPTAGSPSIIEVRDGEIAALREGKLVMVSPDQGATWRGVGQPLADPVVGLTYSLLRKSFYAWRFDCGADTVPIGQESIQALAYDAG